MHRRVSCWVALTLALGACASAPRVARPAWTSAPLHDLAPAEVLAGVGSAPGADGDSASAARRAALAALAEQLLVHVEAELTELQIESTLQHPGSAPAAPSSVSRTHRERLVVLTTEAGLPGARFDHWVDPGPPAHSWARAVVDRALLGEALAERARPGLAEAREQLAEAERLFAAGTPQLPRAIAAVAAAEQALLEPRALLPLVRAVQPGPSGAALVLAARLPSIASAVDGQRARVLAALELRPSESTRPEPLGGLPRQARFVATWQGRPLPGLLVAARVGGGRPSLGATDADGHVDLQLHEDAARPGALRLGPAVRGDVGPIAVELPLARPDASGLRVVIASRHELRDAGGQLVVPTVPSPIEAEVATRVGQRRFAVVTAAIPVDLDPLADTTPPRFQDAADYLLAFVTRTSFSSADGPDGPFWYRTAIEGRWTHIASGASFAFVVPAEASLAAGATLPQASDRSQRAALAHLLDADSETSLVAALAARYR